MTPTPRDTPCAHPIRERDRDATDETTVVERCPLCDEVWIEPRRKQ